MKDVNLREQEFSAFLKPVLRVLSYRHKKVPLPAWIQKAAQGAVLIRQLTGITVSSVMPVLVYPGKL